MKQVICMLLLLIIASCGQSNQPQEALKKNSQVADTIITNANTREDVSDPTTQYMQILKEEFKMATLYQLTDKIRADFNGDGFKDYAIFTTLKGKTGIIIRHGNSDEVVKIGFGKAFAHLEDFDWVDFWGLVMDKETYEVVVTDGEIIGDKRVLLKNPSIIVRDEEEGGGLIVFDNKKYRWVHQAE
jgi:hypothetical protein